MKPEVIDRGVLVGSIALNLTICVDVPMWLQGDIKPCFEYDPELFFPEEYGLAYSKQIKAAKAVCGRCPIIEQCLDWAVQRPRLQGVWGGTTPLERRRIRKAREQVAS